ncbi:MAG TPA: hypothetical protein VKO42_04430 [Patescibacteria group bacterium]|nr:hypothetical protein [Patescibacteria group bacterium]
MSFLRFLFSAKYREEVRKEKLDSVQSQIAEVNKELGIYNRYTVEKIHRNAADLGSFHEQNRKRKRLKEVAHNENLLFLLQEQERRLKKKLGFV